jgi:hypothetical protein
MRSPDASLLIRRIRTRLAPVGVAPDRLVHYDLALAYLEMGLRRDCLNELTLYVALPLGASDVEVQSLMTDLRALLL